MQGLYSLLAASLLLLLPLAEAKDLTSEIEDIQKKIQADGEEDSVTTIQSGISTLPGPTYISSKAPALAPEKKSFNLSFSSSFNSSLHSFDDPEHTYDNDLLLSPGMTMENGPTISLVLSGNKNLVNERKWAWNDAYVGVSKSIGKHSDWAIFSLIGRGYIPLSETSKKMDKLRFQFMLGPQVAMNFKDAGTSITYRPYANFYAHDYEVSLSGKSNNRYSLGNRLIIGQELSERWSITLDNIYSRAFTYQGNTKDSFVFDQSVSFMVTKTISTSLGHSNSGSALAVNGINSNVSVFDSRTSVVYLGFEYIY